MSAGGAVAALSMHAETRVVEGLREAGAFSSETAIALQHSRFMQHGAVRRLLRHGAISEVGQQRYWLDEAAYQSMLKRRRGRIGLLFAILIAALIIAIVGIGTADAHLAQTSYQSAQS